MGINIDQPDLDIGDAGRVCGGFGFEQKRMALFIGFKHEIDQGAGAAGSFLFNAAEAGLFWIGHCTGLRRKLAGNHPEKCCLASAIAADKTDAGIIGQGSASSIKQKARANAVGEIVDM